MGTFATAEEAALACALAQRDQEPRRPNVGAFCGGFVVGQLENIAQLNGKRSEVKP